MVVTPGFATRPRPAAPPSGRWCGRWCPSWSGLRLRGPACRGSCRSRRRGAGSGWSRRARAVGYLAAVVDLGELGAALEAVLDNPAALLGAVVLYAGGVRAAGVGLAPGAAGPAVGQSWAALHVCLLGNHLLPFRLGEALRVTSVLRRTAAADHAGHRLGGGAAGGRPARGAVPGGGRRRPLVAGEFGIWGWLLAAVLLVAGARRGGRLAVLRAAARRCDCPAPGWRARPRPPGCWRPP